ncbi:GNAT family N-acetyltransferase [Kineococcus arenarius]|uniref:GNAT family N-acetyltransferase n=1 Tax=unclassified Kineococcus TaxID=2621656 RepID=UPI003D7E95BB
MTAMTSVAIAPGRRNDRDVTPSRLRQDKDEAVSCPDVQRCRVIRAAERRDLPRLRDIERAAGAAFRDVDMATIADDDPPTVAALQQYQAGGRAWVATDDSAGDDVAVAYLLLDVVDEAAHVEQVSVDPSHAHRGLGRQLIETAASWAAEHGFDVVTLTTFAEVPWNAPYYARLGFTVVPEAELGPGLSAVRRHERELGLDAWPRVGMRRAVRTQNVVGD